MAALLVTGGANFNSPGGKFWTINTVEMFDPASGASCLLPPLPGNRAWHTLDRCGEAHHYLSSPQLCSGLLVCGGVSGGWGEHGWDDYHPVDSCLTLDTRSGGWVLSHNLTVSR